MNNGLSQIFPRSERLDTERAVPPSYGAFCSSPNLADDIINGLHPIDVWANHENLNLGHLADIFGISLGRLYSMQHADEDPYLSLTVEQVNAFCGRIGVHPADLVPRIAHPGLALPLSLLQANFAWMDRADATSAERELANEAIRVEEQRYNLFLNDVTPLSHHFNRAVSGGALAAVLNKFIAPQMVSSSGVRHTPIFGATAFLGIADMVMEEYITMRSGQTFDIYLQETMMRSRLVQSEGRLMTAYCRTFGFQPSPELMRNIMHLTDKCLASIADVPRREKLKVVRAIISEELHGAAAKNGDTYFPFSYEIANLSREITKYGHLLNEKANMADQLYDADTDITMCQNFIALPEQSPVKIAVRRLFANKYLIDTRACTQEAESIMRALNHG